MVGDAARPRGIMFGHQTRGIELLERHLLQFVRVWSLLLTSLTNMIE